MAGAPIADQARRPEAAAEACGARGIDTATAGATVVTAAELAARQRHAARQREGHRGAAWEGLPEMMREEMAYRELAAIVDNEQRIAAPAAGTGCGFARASRLVAGGYLLRTWLDDA